MLVYKQLEIAFQNFVFLFAFPPTAARSGTTIQPPRIGIRYLPHGFARHRKMSLHFKLSSLFFRIHLIFITFAPVNEPHKHYEITKDVTSYAVKGNPV